MKVKKLIRLLQGLPPKTDVVVNVYLNSNPAGFQGALLEVEEVRSIPEMVIIQASSIDFVPAQDKVKSV